MRQLHELAIAKTFKWLIGATNNVIFLHNVAIWLIYHPKTADISHLKLSLISLINLHHIVFTGCLSLDCRPGEFPSYVFDGNLQIQVAGSVTRDGVLSVVGCQQQCDSEAGIQCVSFSYSPVSMQCELYPARTGDPRVVDIAKADAVYYVTICNQSKQAPTLPE